MRERLIIGNKLIQLDEIDSTNVFLKGLLEHRNQVYEGLVVSAKTQLVGKGQRGTTWLAEGGKNLTFSLYLQPNLAVKNQFLISKMIAIAIAKFLEFKGIENVKIKWPNDIYCGNKKIAGILIENTLKNAMVFDSVIGLGLNVNQTVFDEELLNPTSVKLELLGSELELEKALDELLSYIDVEYLQLKRGEFEKINQDYLKYLYRYNKRANFEVNGEEVSAKIVGISEIGRLVMELEDGKREFDLKEVKFK